MTYDDNVMSIQYIHENDGQRRQWKGRQQAGLEKMISCSVETEVLRLIQVARPCLGPLSEPQESIFNLGRKREGHTIAVFDC